MFRVACAVALLGVAVSAGGALAGEKFKGKIKDVQGTNGILVLTVGAGEKTEDRDLLIRDARFVGPTGSELKAGDLRPGDVVEVEMAADGKQVQEVRVLPARP